MSQAKTPFELHIESSVSEYNHLGTELLSLKYIDKTYKIEIIKNHRLNSTKNLLTATTEIGLLIWIKGLPIYASSKSYYKPNHLQTKKEIINLVVSAIITTERRLANINNN